MDKELLNKLKYLCKKKKSLFEIKETLGLTENEIFMCLNMLGIKFNFDLDGNIHKSYEIDKTTYIIPNNKEKLSLIFLGDTHLSSKYDDVDKIKRVYDMPCDYYFHCGDFTDGFVPVNDYEKHLKETTYEGQIGYSLHYYPVSDRKTFIVNGNHDEYLYKIYNRDIVKEICDVRDELIYLGPKERRVKIGTFDMLIMHGDRDSKTGSSIKMEKYVNSIIDKPDLIHLGHKHTYCDMTVSNVEVIRTPSLMKKIPHKRFDNYESGIYKVDIVFDDDEKVKSITKKRVII